MCPTGLTQFRDFSDEFKRFNAQVIGCSVDSVHSHKRWVETDLKDLGYLLIGDITKQVAIDYGVLLAKQGIATREASIIDPQDTIQYIDIHNLKLEEMQEKFCMY